MNCPNCRSSLSATEYEGIQIEACPSCGGHWLDADELAKIIQLREEKFDEEERRALARATTINEVHLPSVDRNLTCPKCGGTTDPINYYGDTGIVIDRCTGCHGIWLDGGELEKIQMLVEGWEDILPEEVKKYQPMLQQVTAELDERLKVRVSRVPVVGRFIDAVINGILYVSM